jgi:hypothetical protein
MDFLTNAVPAAVKGLPPAAHQQYVDAVMAALRPVFLVAAGIAALAFVLTTLLQEIELRDSAPAEGMTERLAMARDEMPTPPRSAQPGATSMARLTSE